MEEVTVHDDMPHSDRYREPRVNFKTLRLQYHTVSKAGRKSASRSGNDWGNLHPGEGNMDDEYGLFNIELEESEKSIDESEKVPRGIQTEEDFQRQRKDWKPKFEVTKLFKTLKLPIDNPTKPQSQTILHAIEELYFFKMYQEAQKLAGDALKGKLNQDSRETILDYKGRCEAKLLGVQEGNKETD